MNWPPGKVEPIESHYKIESCENILEKPGDIPKRLLGSPEDITIDHDTGIAYISSLDHRAFQKADGNDHQELAKPGAIFRYNIDAGGPFEKMDVFLQGSTSEFSANDIFPHGISLFSIAEGELQLFVVNKQIGKTPNGNEKADVVDIFDVEGKILRHTYRAKELISDF